MYERLQAPGQIGGVTIPNRVVMTAARTQLADEAGNMTEAMLAYYERRAKGGVGLIVTEAVYVDAQYGVSVVGEMPASDDGCIAQFSKLSQRIHPYGTKLFAQLFHPGGNADAALSPGGLISASARKSKGGVVREATLAEIDHVVQAFGAAALRMQAAGLDGVEIHAAHNYLIQDFLSPVTNHRTDEFGGSLENRSRLLRRIVEEIIARCGAAFPIMVRVSLEEYIGVKGYHADEGIKLCQWLEQWGAAAINVTAGGTSSKLSQSMEPITYRQGWRKHLMKAVKKSVGIPVCGVAIIRDPAFAEKLLAEGYTDFVGSVRAHLAEPDWANKAFAGQEILSCISCMSCLEMEYKLGKLTCALNPETGYESSCPKLEENGGGRLVLVLGAGPAGLEAAWIAAKRGFQVKLYEKSKHSGGQMRLAGLVPRKDKILGAIKTLEARCRRAGVEMFFACTPTVEALKAQKPYAILDATGGTAALPKAIDGLEDNPLVCTPEEIITNGLDLREESVVVVGSGMTGLETAEILSDWSRNNAVLVLEAAPRLAPGVLGSNRNVVTAVLDANGVVYQCDRRLERVGTDRIYLSDTRSGEAYEYPCDRVVLAVGVKPADPYGQTLEEACALVKKIGDAQKSGKIWHAIHDGYEAAMKL